MRKYKCGPLGGYLDGMGTGMVNVRLTFGQGWRWARERSKLWDLFIPAMDYAVRRKEWNDYHRHNGSKPAQVAIWLLIKRQITYKIAGCGEIAQNPFAGILNSHSL